MKRTLLTAAIILMMALLVSCKGAAEEKTVSENDPFQGREPSIVLGYEGMEGYEGDIMLRDTNVLEVKELMDAKESFVLFLSFESCPWCNLIIPYVNDAARDAGVLVGYIDTRSNPEWKSNMDIDNYDIFTEMFSKYLATDEDGKPHLYVPDLYVIKKGKVVARHDGVTPGLNDPSEPMTAEQEEQLRKDLANEFKAMN